MAVRCLPLPRHNQDLVHRLHLQPKVDGHLLQLHRRKVSFCHEEKGSTTFSMLINLVSIPGTLTPLNGWLLEGQLDLRANLPTV